MDEGRTDGKSAAALPLIERKERLRALFARPIRGLRFSDYVRENSPRFREEVCRPGVEGVVSKRVDRPYAPSDRRFSLKARSSLASDGASPAGAARTSALCCSPITDDGKLHDAGRAGMGLARAQRTT